MITRIVKLTISPSKKEEFKSIFLLIKITSKTLKVAYMLNFFKTKNTIMYFLHTVNGKEKNLLKNTDNQNFSEVFGKNPKLAFALHLRHGVQMNYLAYKFSLSNLF